MHATATKSNALLGERTLSGYRSPRYRTCIRDHEEGCGSDDHKAFVV